MQRIIILIIIALTCFALVALINIIERRAKRNNAHQPRIDDEPETVITNHQPESPEQYNEHSQNADIERWRTQNFCIGYRINRPRDCDGECEICRIGEGIYPLSFDWVGWHPNCRCFITPINIDEDTFADIMSHDDWETALKRIVDAQRITEYPERFKRWVTEHRAEIVRKIASHEYCDFVTTNPDIFDDDTKTTQNNPMG
jgi:hypothetical protein